MNSMIKKNFKYGTLLSSVLFALSAMSACSDYAGEYEDDWDAVYGDDAKVEGETPSYSADCENMLWYAYDGKDFMAQTTLGTSWESFTKGSSDILFTGLDKNNIRFNANFLETDLTPYLKYKGGISGQLIVPDGASDFLAGVRFRLDGINLSDNSKYTGLCLAYKSAYDEIMLSLMELGDRGDVRSEYRSANLGSTSEVKTVKVPLESFSFKSGEKSFSKFLEKANSLGVIFTSTKRNSEGFVIVGVGTYGGNLASSSSSAKATSNSSKTSSSSAKATSSSSKISSSSTKATSSSSKTSSSSAKVTSSSSMFYWTGYDRDYQLHTGFEGDDAGWWFHYTDSSLNGNSYFQWPADLDENGGLTNVIDTCKGVCGAVHVWPGFDAPFAGLGFAVSSKAVDVSKWEGLCVEYASDVPIKVRLEVADPEDYDYDIPIKILDASSVKTTMNIPWENFGSSKAGTGAEVAAKLKTVSFYFDDLSVKDGFFDIIAVGEYDACNASSANDNLNSNVKKLQNKINDNMDLFVDSTHVTGIPTEDILWYGANMVKNNLPTTNSSIVRYSWVDDNTSKYVKFRSENVPNNADSFTDVCRGGFCGTITSVPESGVNEYPAMGLEFNDTIGVADFGGICVTYSASTDALYLSLQSLSDEDREYFDSISWNLFQVQLDASDSVDTKCFKWENFKVDDEKNRPKMFTYLQHVHDVKIGFDAVNAKGMEFNIVAIGKYSEMKDEGLKYLNNKMNRPSAWDFLNPEVTYDTFVDSRDGQEYKAVKIGEQVWMAENLNYVDSAATQSLKGNVDCAYDEIGANCDLLGAMYTWNAAIDDANISTQHGVGKLLDLGDKHQGICPEGWHLPSKGEFEVLAAEVGWTDGGKYMSTTVGWGENIGPVTNESGFSALPASVNFVSTSSFWTSTDMIGGSIYDEVNDFEIGNTSGDSYARVSSVANTNKFFIRCVSDTTFVTQTNSEKCEKGLFCSVYNETTKTLFDARDGQTYKTTTIGDQVWMAENLNYDDDNVSAVCYNGEDSMCETYGRLYSWADAQNVCPSGWHLPSEVEFNELLTTVGSENATKLMAVSGWYDNDGINNATDPVAGYDSYGFCALPAGTYGGGSYKFEKIITYMWSTDVSTEDDFAEGKFESNNARCLWFAGNGIVDMPESYKTKVRNLSKNYKSSVRCLKD